MTALEDTRVILTEQGEIEVVVPPLAGERCALCDRRVNKPRQATSPDSKRVTAKLPADRAAAVEEGLDNLQAYVGADSNSYPRGTLLELLLLLGGQNREALRAHFAGTYTGEEA